ncbi:MAG: tetratricopeptide repeat protein [Deltaproteobacteria bacterium]|nr:tetratricopeptide repeat protein [Deltaproteobacteria bacterium]
MKKLSLIRFLPLIFALTIAVTTEAANYNAVSFSKGVVAFSDGEYKKALVFFLDSQKKAPKDPDTLYFLGLTNFKMNRFGKATGYFKTLLDQNPDYSKAYFDYGLALFRLGKYPESLAWMQKSWENDTTNPAPLFYVALNHYKMQQKEATLARLKQLKENFSETEFAVTSREWVTKLEAGEPLPIALTEAELMKKWVVKGAVSAFYDTNVTYDPDDENLSGLQSNQHDYFGALGLDVQFLAVHTPTTTLYFNYSGYQSAYANVNSDVDRFNLGRQIGGAELGYKMSDKLQVRLQGTGMYYTLGRQRYLVSGLAQPSVDVAWNEKWLTTFYAAFRRDQFAQALTVSTQNRDADNYTWGVEQYFFFPGTKNRFARVGFTSSVNSAKGADWDYRDDQIDFAFNTPLWWQLEFLAMGNVDLLRKFDHVDSIYGVRRGDFTVYTTAVLTRPLVDHLNASVTYSYILTDSNIPAFTYHRQLMGFTLSAEL